MALSAQEVSKKILSILSKGTDPFRKKLDVNNHLLDFSYTALKISDPDLTQADYELLLLEIHKSNRFKLSHSVKYSLGVANDPSAVRGYLAFIEDPKYGTYLLARDYGKIQEAFSAVLKSITHTSSLTNTLNGVIQTNIGHIASGSLRATSTPLAELIKNISSRLPLASSNVVMQELFRLQSQHDFDASYQFQRPNFDIKGFDKILGTSTILVTAHSFKVNNTLATRVEGLIVRDLKAYVSSPEFIQHIVDSHGSKTLRQEIYEGLVAAMTGKAYQSPHTKKSPSTSKQSIKSTGSLTTVKPPPIRNLQGKFYSLNSLQVLLDRHLQDVIAANMGDEGYPGGQRKILNYRTGRFAASAKVERLTQSREGLITAFYAYQKNPYQVFEPGHRMGSPATRDPKLLISKSIREVSATVVGNRMRAVSI